MTYACIVCDGDGLIVTCNCGPGQRLSDHLSRISQQPYASTPQMASIASSPMNTEATTPDMAPSQMHPNTTVASHFIPTSPVGGFHYGTR